MEKKLKVLMLNGSPHENGNTALAFREMEQVFRENGVDYVAVSKGNETNDIPVTVGMTTETVAEIVGGYLKEGDNVVVPSIDSSILRDMGLN